MAKDKPDGGGAGTTKIALATIVGAIIGAGGMILSSLIAGRLHAAGAESRPTPTVTATVRLPAWQGPEHVTITGPREGEKLCRQVTVQGVGAVPEGQALVVAMQQAGDDQRYFEQPTIDENESAGWSADILLGDSRASGEFTIWALSMDRRLAAYLSRTNTYQGSDNTWWAAPAWPESSRALDTRNVKRLARC